MSKTDDLFVDLSPDQLLANASKQLGAEISLIEAGKLLTVCDLHRQDKYTQQECDRFIAACILKQQGRTYEEVATELAIAKFDENKILVEEINSLLNQASLIQIEQIRAMLPQLAIEQLQEIKALFWRMTSQRLRQYVDSGELEAQIKLVSSSALIRSGN
jgi:hypothetical protein